RAVPEYCSMSDLPEAYYLPLGDGRYEPTRATESPWDTDNQHGGPPTALMAHLIDEAAGPGLRLARIAVDFLGPIPRREMRVEVSPVRPGRLISLSEARIVADGRTVVSARAWHIATGPTPPADGEEIHPPALPDTPSDDFHSFPGLAGWGYGEAIEWRFTKGGFGALGPAEVWTRVRIRRIAGERLTGLAVMLIVAASANGLSAVLPIDEWYSIPPGMTTTLMRTRAGEWMHLSCHTHLSGDGLGVAHGTLCD